MLVWNVFLENFNAKRIDVYNIFKHTALCDDLAKSLKKNKDDKEAFASDLKRSLMYYYWSKCEYEIILTSWPEMKGFHDEKVDVYDQIMLNWDVFLDYVWTNREELHRKGNSNGRRKKDPD